MTTSIRRRVVLAWSLWDWGSASWNAVVTSFAGSYTHLTLPTTPYV